jgi:hypothetical protein
MTDQPLEPEIADMEGVDEADVVEGLRHDPDDRENEKTVGMPPEAGSPPTPDDRGADAAPPPD